MSTIQKIQEHYGVHLLTSEPPSNSEVVSCFGLVHGQAIMGANFIKDFFAKVADVTGGRVSGYEKALAAATREAVEIMTRSAAELGANTVVAVKLQTSSVGPRMLLAACSGTAVILREKRVDEPDNSSPRQYVHSQPLG